MTVKHYGIRFNGRHSWEDEGLLLLQEKEIGIPNKKKVTIQVPFSNEVYDFSTVYGGQLYEQRTLTYNIQIQQNLYGTKEAMNMTKTKVINWLMGTTGYTKLVDDAFPGYYFMAEVQGNSAFVEDWNRGVLKVTFTAYPFMISEKAEGNDIWDEINFDLDVLQDVSFTVKDKTTILLYHNGISLARPEITATAPFTLTLDGNEHQIKVGSHTYDYLTLSAVNEIHLSGTGRIDFKWHKELI